MMFDTQGGKIIHILGSNIPHHNRTLLTFFATQIAPNMAEKPKFWVVSDADFTQEFPELDIQIFSGKKTIAQAIIATFSQDPTAYCFFHGQFNLGVWLAILVGKIPPERCAWHIWGADLYESSTAWKFRLFYPFRRFAQKRLHTVFGTQGNLDFFCKINPKSNRLLLYFPTKMPQKVPLFSKEGLGEIWWTKNSADLTILLGNSGDPSNLHLRGLDQLYQQLGKNVQLKIPMGYPANNQAYIAQVREKAEQLFGCEQVEIWDEPQEFANYLQNLTACDLGYFPFERQQGIGTICLLIEMGIPVVLNSQNPFCMDMHTQQVPFLLESEISREHIQTTHQQLLDVDKTKIAFFPQSYKRMWLERMDSI